MERLENKLLLWEEGIIAEEKNIACGARKYSNEIESKK